jgi:beta-propeller repeat-containing protein/putative Ig domain-containing protein
MRGAGRVLSALGLFVLAADGRAANLDLMRLPLRFEENVGQADPKVRFLARGAGYGIYVTDNELVTTLHRDSRPFAERRRTECDDAHCSRAVVRMQLLHSAMPACFVAGERLPGKSNYFIGNDPGSWHTDIPQYDGVRLEDVYEGIDLVYRGVEGRLEYDFIVKPGGSPKRIRLRIQGGDEIRVDASGDLIIRTPAGDLRQRVPSVYQDVAGERRAVKGGYRRIGRTDFAFELGPYDSNRPLVIDPAIEFSTYVGGSIFDVPQAVKVDSSGNAYVAGETNSTDFPIVNPYQPTEAGNTDGFVMKIDSTGTNVLYSTFLGGSSLDEIFGLAIDGTGAAYVTGETLSTDFPTSAAIHGTNSGNLDAFIAKLSPAGSGLVYSTYFGGSAAEAGQSIAVDAGGNAFVVGQTGSTDFPVASAIQGSYGGGSGDAFVVMINGAGNAVVYSTYLGGSDFEVADGIALDSGGNAHVCGYTFSTNFPTVSPYQAANAGNTDTFVTKINSAGSALLYSTYLGGSDADNAAGIAVDAAGNAYVGGLTSSPNFPVLSAAQSTLHGGVEAFVTKLNSNGSTLGFSTFLGGQADDYVQDLALDSSANVHVTGYTNSLDFPTVAGVQMQLAGTYDAIVTILSSAGSIVFSTYLGGTLNDIGYAIAVDSAGSDYIVGSTSSSDFPTHSAIQPQITSANCGFLTKIRRSGTLTISPTLLPDGHVGYPYLVDLTAVGGTGPYTFSVSSGPLPPGMTLSSDGELSGNPLFEGRFAFTLRATDSLGAIGDSRYALLVAQGANPPTGVVALGASSTSVNITWNTVQGANSYRVYRRSFPGYFTVVGNPSAPPFTDTTAVADTAYLYVVTALMNTQSETPFSNPDIANTYTFTDAPLAAGDTIKAVHLVEIRNLVTSFNSLLGITKSYTDPVLTSSIMVKAVHITELRSAIDTIRQAVGLPAFNYTNVVLVPGASIIKAVDVQQLRVALR